MNELHAVDVAISDIKPYENNPRINEATIQKLVNLIPRVGFNQPLLLNRDNVIVKGHARYEACKRLGYKTIPCIYTDNSEELVKFDRIADNKVHEFTQWDKVELGHEIDMLNTDFNMADLGVNVDSDYDFISEFEEDNEDESPTLSDEEKRERYLQLLKDMQKDNQETPVITTQAEIDFSKEKQSLIAKNQKELIPIECSGCGQIMYVEKSKIIDIWVDEEE